MTGINGTPPISVFYRLHLGKIAMIRNIAQEQTFNIKCTSRMVSGFQPLVQNVLQENRKYMRDQVWKEMLPRFVVGYFVLIVRENFNEKERQYLYWHGPRRILRAMNDYMNLIKDLKNWAVWDVHRSRLKFCQENSLNKEEIRPHALTCNTGMPVQRHMSLHDRNWTEASRALAWSTWFWRYRRTESKTLWICSGTPHEVITPQEYLESLVRKCSQRAER